MKHDTKMKLQGDPKLLLNGYSETQNPVQTLLPEWKKLKADGNCLKEPGLALTLNAGIPCLAWISRNTTPRASQHILSICAG